MNRPVVKKTGKRQWQLVEPFNGVPAGFTTNGASVPRPLWWFIDPAGEAFEAAIRHDYDIDAADKSRFKMESHKRFRDAMISYNVRKWKAYIAYWFVCAYWLVKGAFK